MRPVYLFLSMSLFLLFSSPDAMAAASISRINPPSMVEKTVEQEAALSKKEIRQERKSFKKELKAKLKELRASDDLLLLIIIAILLPPLAMYLYEGSITNRFWISLLLTLLFYLPGLVYTLIVILGEN